MSGEAKSSVQDSDEELLESRETHDAVQEELDNGDEDLRKELLSALEMGSLETVQDILGSREYFLEPCFLEPILPELVHALRVGRVDCVKALIADVCGWYQYEAVSDVEAGSFLLSTAARSGQQKCLIRLIFLGVGVNGPVYGYSALFEATKNDHVSCVHTLLQAGANPNWNNTCKNRLPIHVVQSVTCAKLLLEYGADINSVYTDGGTALCTAISRNNFETSKYFLDLGARPDRSPDHWVTPLIEAVHSDIGLVSLLLSYGADLEEKDTRGRTAVLEAVKWHNIVVLRFLLKSGASAKAKDDRGHTALHFAAMPSIMADEEFFQECVQLLVEHNADVDAIDNEGYTPLAIAIEMKHLAALTALLKYGATETGLNLTSALQVARENADGVGKVLRDHFLKTRLRKLRGIFRFIVMSRRYREDFYRYKYVNIGTTSFAHRKRLQENLCLNGEQVKRFKSKPRSSKLQPKSQKTVS